MADPKDREATWQPAHPGVTAGSDEDASRPEKADVSALNNPDELRAAAASEGSGVSGNLKKDDPDQER